MSAKRFAARFLPPIVRDMGRYISNRLSREFDYLPGGWDSGNSRIRGWNVESVVSAQKARWPLFLRAVRGPGPLTVAHPIWNVREATARSEQDYTWHNIIMAYAYVLALAARQRDRVSLLDWGGGVGQHYVLGKVLVPQVEIDYHCKELPLLCQYGRELFPEASFYEDEEGCFKNTYDLVMASDSLQYSRDWRTVVSRLASVSRSYLYVAHLPILHHEASFVVVQRPYRHGYLTEYQSWHLNRAEFLNHMSAVNMELVREFLFGERLHVARAPEQGELRGFLFRPSGRGMSG